jgi:hypothetical protein
MESSAADTYLDPFPHSAARRYDGGVILNPDRQTPLQIGLAK